MRNDRTKVGLRSWIAGGAALLLATVCACGQGAVGVSVPLYAGNVVPLLDEFGRPMRGSPSAADAADRPKVEIRKAHEWNGSYRAYPPGINGDASPFNPLVSTNLPIGMGMNSVKANSGLFCAVFSQRPDEGIRMFARVFNAPTPEQATFYADSDAVEVKSVESTVVFSFRPLTPLDPADDDGDGLANSWEELLGINDRPTSDYDGDGMSDLHEMLAGTAADDKTSKLSFHLIRGERSTAAPGAGGVAPRAIRLKWQSVPGKKYRLEYVAQLVSDVETGLAHEIIPVGDVVTAGPGEYEIDMLVENLPADAVTGMFRIMLVP